MKVIGIFVNLESAIGKHMESGLTLTESCASIFIMENCDRAN